MGKSPDLAGPLSNGSAPHGSADEAAKNRANVLGSVIETLADARIDFLVIGGIATSTWGRPGAIRDIDLFLTRHGAERAMEALDRAGFTTEISEPDWLYKAFKDGVLVDLIFSVKGGITLDAEMLARSRTRDVFGTSVPLVSPEDLIVMLACSHKADTPYWHNALSVLERSSIDWDYLLRRAESHPDRLASLFLFARSEGVELPQSALDLIAVRSEAG